MYIVLFISILALFFTFLESKKFMPNGMKWGFVLVTFLGCIHYDYGNDYLAYMDIYNSIVRYPFDLENIVLGVTFKEPIWALLCYMFKPIGGFFMMVAVLNIFQNVLIYRTIKKYVEKPWWPMSVFVYLFTYCLYLLNFSMMRQGLVVCIFFGIWQWIEEKKWIKSLIVLLICFTIHKSALVLLPFAFWGIFPTKNSKLLITVFFFTFVALWFSVSFMNDILSAFMSVEEISTYYDIYGNSDKVVSFGVGYLINLIPFVLGLIYFQDRDNKALNKSVVALAIIAFLIMPFASIIPLITRVSYYFVVYQIIAIPIIYGSLHKRIIKIGLLGIYMFMVFYDYIGFFSSPVWVDKYTTFKTIFSQIF